MENNMNSDKLKLRKATMDKIDKDFGDIDLEHESVYPIRFSGRIIEDIDDMPKFHRHSISIIDNILERLSEDKIKHIENNNIINLIVRDLERIKFIFIEESHSDDGVIPVDLIENLTVIAKNIALINSESDKKVIQSKFEQIRLRSFRCYMGMMEIKKRQTEKMAINSQEFYESSIADAQKQIEELSQEIQQLKKNKSSDEDVAKKSAEKEKEIAHLTRIIKLFEERENERKIRDDVIATWNTKITDAFKLLDKHIDPIKKEHKRLCELYWAYNILSIGIIALLVVIEIVICYKLYAYDEIPKFKDYLLIALPVPIAVGLLWGFITQMNRAQRQRVVLSKNIHDIKYTEGILLSINNLSTDVSSSTKRINDALDKLLDKHLSHDSWEGSESRLKMEERKDAIPYESLIQIIKSLRGVI